MKDDCHDRIDRLERSIPGTDEIRVPGLGTMKVKGVGWLLRVLVGLLAAGLAWLWADRERLITATDRCRDEIAAVKLDVATLRQDVSAAIATDRRFTPQDAKICIEAAYSEDPAKMERCRVLLRAKDGEGGPHG